MFSATVRDSNSGEVLEHHADAQTARLGRVADMDLLAFPLDRAGIGVLHAVDDLDQRALAGAVLAEKGVNLAGRKRQIDGIVREAARKLLGDAAKGQSRRVPARRVGHAFPRVACRDFDYSGVAADNNNRLRIGDGIVARQNELKLRERVF